MIHSSSFSKFLRIGYFGWIINLLQLLHASLLMRHFKEWELVSDLNLEPIQLLLCTLSVCFIILLACHWNGCLQFFIPMMQGFPNNSWVVKPNLTLCQVEQYKKNRRLPWNLQLKISSYYKEHYHGKWFDQEGIVSELSEYFREDILGYLCRDLVNNVPMFQNADPNFLKAVITNLCYEVFQKDDVIIREDAAAERTFFIESGIVSVGISYYQKLLSDGAYSGEICLLTKGFHKATVRAVTLCKLYSLTADKCNDLLKQFPAAMEDVVNMATQRQRALIKAIDLWKLSRALQSP